MQNHANPEAKDDDRTSNRPFCGTAAKTGITTVLFGSANADLLTPLHTSQHVQYAYRSQLHICITTQQKR